MENPLEKVLSTEILTPIAKQFLPKQLSPKAGVKFLKKTVTANFKRGTDFINITAKNKSHKTAVQIANAIAESYMAYRNASENSRAASALEALDAELIFHKELIQTMRLDLIAFAKSASIILNPSNLDHTSEEQFEKLLEAKFSSTPSEKQQLSEKWQDLQNATALLSEMKKQQQEQRELLSRPRTPVTISQLAH